MTAMTFMHELYALAGLKCVDDGNYIDQWQIFIFIATKLLKGVCR